jgi:V/A-type H+-transporting ATPase subunit K
MIELIAALGSIAPILQEAGEAGGPALTASGAAAIGVGLAALGAGIAERGIGAAAMGAIAEDRDLFGLGLIMTVLPETLVILALVVVFIV